MRLAAQMRGGYYPAPARAVTHAATFLRAPRREPFAILDPCAGEGAALQQLGDLLGCPPTLTYAIELDNSRADTLLASLPKAHRLAPADCFGCRATPNSFSFIWLNPPFDFSYGGYRVEVDFLRRATDWLRPGGVLALVCPEDVIGAYSDARRHLVTWYEHCSVVPFPVDCRPFHEVVVFGHKRTKPQIDAGETGGETPWTHTAAREFIYRIPPGNGPRLFQKVEPTEEELQRMLAASPLRSHLTLPPEAPLPSPPLALGIGHIALLLASGHLDGVVQLPGGPPQVVRGTSRKRSFVSAVSNTENPDGSVSTRTTITERIDLVVRTVDLAGNIHTLGDTEDETSLPPQPHPEENHPPAKEGLRGSEAE